MKLIILVDYTVRNLTKAIQRIFVRSYIDDVTITQQTDLPGNLPACNVVDMLGPSVYFHFQMTAHSFTHSLYTKVPPELAPPPQLPVLRLSLNAGIPEHPISRNNRRGTGPWSRRGSRSSWDERGEPRC